MVSNPNTFSQAGTSSLGQIVDGADFPHTGLLKSLAAGVAGNYVISGFDITPTGNSSRTGTVGNGVIFQNGAERVIDFGGSNNTFDLGAGTASENFYSLLVIQADGTLFLRTPPSKDRVADINAGDAVIAVLTRIGNTSTAFQIQYLTYNKTSNSLSIGRLDNNAYKESLTIKSNAGDVEIEATEEDKDIIFKVKDGNTAGAEVMRIDAADKRVGIGTNAPVAPLHVMTSNTDETLRLQSDDATATTAPDLIFHRNSASPAATDGIGHIKFLGRNAANNADIMYAAMYASIRDTTAGQEDGSLIFTTETAGNDRNRFAIMPTEVVINDNMQPLNFRVEGDTVSNLLFVDGVNDKIGIKESNPDTELHMKSGATVEPTITLENTNADGTSSGIHFVKNSASPAVGDNLGVIKYTGDNTVNGVHQFAEILTEATNVTNGAETSKFTFKVSKAGTLTPVMQITDTEVMVNDNAVASNTLNFRAQSNNNQNMFLVDATNDRVGIGTATPATMLHLKSSGTGEPIVTLENNNDDGQEPQLVFKKNGTSPANSDDLGIIRFVGDDSNGSAHLYAYIMADAEDVTAGAEKGRILFVVSKAGTNVELLGISHDEIVINDAGGDTNLRVEGDNNANLLFVDATNDMVGIGTNSPAETLDVVGSLGVSQRIQVATGGTFRSPRLPMVSVSASTTLTEATHAGAYLKCAGNVTLPATSGDGVHFTILNTTNGNITVSPSVSTNINGGSNGAAITVASYNAVTCIAIGSNNWIALGV